MNPENVPLTPRKMTTGTFLTRQNKFSPILHVPRDTTPHPDTPPRDLRTIYSRCISGFFPTFSFTRKRHRFSLAPELYVGLFSMNARLPSLFVGRRLFPFSHTPKTFKQVSAAKTHNDPLSTLAGTPLFCAALLLGFLSKDPRFTLLGAPIPRAQHILSALRNFALRLVPRLFHALSVFIWNLRRYRVIFFPKLTIPFTPPPRLWSDHQPDSLNSFTSFLSFQGLIPLQGGPFVTPQGTFPSDDFRPKKTHGWPWTHFLHLTS